MSIWRGVIIFGALCGFVLISLKEQKATSQVAVAFVDGSSEELVGKGEDSSLLSQLGSLDIESLILGSTGFEGDYSCFPDQNCNESTVEGCERTEVVHTRQGQVQGFIKTWNVPSPVNVFFGLPYAQPPVDDLRLRSPRPLPNNMWKGIRNATRLSNMCSQSDISLPSLSPVIGSEDCLYLNIYTPSNVTHDSKLPVMVWLHGGGFVIGDGNSNGAYDASRLVAPYNVVVVSLNYRLGALGFFASDELKNEDEHASTGNMGLQDQRMALEWIKDNIEEFGGDKSRVTLFGESAGAFSVMWHLTSPLSAGLFHAVIAESGSSRMNWFFQSYKNATLFYDQLTRHMGCGKGLLVTDTLKCLRSKPTQDFIISVNKIIEDTLARDTLNISLSFIPSFASPLAPVMPFGPVVDQSPHGTLQVPLDALSSGNFNRVPVLLGANQDEGSLFVILMRLIIPHMKFPMTNDQLHDCLMWVASDREHMVDEIMRLYSTEDFPGATNPYWVRFSRIMRDVAFHCPNRWTAASLADQDIPTYLYSFAFDELGENKGITDLGDYHGCELNYVFNLYGNSSSPNKQKMSHIISSRWTNFARCHDPNGCDDGESVQCDSCGMVPTWPRYSTHSEKIMILDSQCSVRDVHSPDEYPDDAYPTDERCDFWLSRPLMWRDFD